MGWWVGCFRWWWVRLGEGWRVGLRMHADGRGHARIAGIRGRGTCMRMMRSGTSNVGWILCQARWEPIGTAGYLPVCRGGRRAGPGPLSLTWVRGKRELEEQASHEDENSRLHHVGEYQNSRL